MVRKLKVDRSAESATAKSFLAQFDLRDDAGWIAPILDDCQAEDSRAVNAWQELLRIIKEARPSNKMNWAEAQSHADTRCAYLPREFDQIPLPEPGSAEYLVELAKFAPESAWLERIRALALQLGAERFARMLGRVYHAASHAGAGRLNRPGANRDFLVGLIWCVAAVPEPELISRIAQLAIWCANHRTTQAGTIRLVLAYTATEHTAAALRTIVRSAKRANSAERLVRLATHVERRLGISSEESSERFVPTFQLDAAGRRTEALGDAALLEFTIDGASVSIRCRNAQGKELKTLPSSIKKAHASNLKAFKALAKQVQRTLLAERDRIDSMFLADRKWEVQSWRRYYLEHPLVGHVARRLIWKCGEEAFVFNQGRLEDVHGHVIVPPDNAIISQWHPIHHAEAEITTWRHRLSEIGITQPFKQAHREVYILTDAERMTATYSNRFAAHIIRQGQFRALAGARNWKSPTVGYWGQDPIQIASKELPDGWKAEFWISASDAADQAPSGALAFLSTDQVRFYRSSLEPTPLEQVPPLLFSEVMRDVDLFVGVSSVGNDPNWIAGGRAARLGDYWHSYSFGDLTATASTRKEVLQRLIPRLKIASQCSFSDKFLIVKGAKRTYKIHLGSGNILMEPNDQYLCIVPDARARAGQETLFLPFEGDNTLSIIISKAFLLADDVKIEDVTILRQIGR